MLKVFALASVAFILKGATASADDGSALERVWFDEYESACMAQMSTGEMGEVEAATWFRVAAARENNALSSFYTVLDAISRARRNDGEAGIVQHDNNGWACKSGVVMTNFLQELGFPLTSKNLLGMIRILSSKYSNPEVVLSAAPDDPVIGAAVHMTNSDTSQGYLNAQFYLLRLLGGELSTFASFEGDETMGGLPITVIAPSLSGVTVRSGGTDFNGETILQLWRDRQRLFGAGLWSGSSPGVIFFSDDQGLVYVAGTDASQNFKIVSFEASEPKARYQELYDRITAEGLIGDDRDVEAEERMASAHPAFEIIMAHVKVHEAWTYTSWFMNVGRKTRPLEELASSVNVALQELE
jgi:hypothetical protein